MGKLPEWESLKTKKKSFSDDSYDIETQNDFDNFYSKLYIDDNYFYRGMNEARYKIYPSAYRTFINEKLDTKCTYNDFVVQVLNAFKENKEKANLPYLFNGNKEIPDIKALSFLQHYECPTPIIDVSIDPKISLFFACYKVILKASKNDIDNYISLYKISISQKMKKKIPDDIFSENNYLTLITKDNADIYQTENILAQKGSFLYISPNYEGKYSLDEILDGSSEPEVISGKTGIHTSSQHQTQFSTQIICYNIHKNLIKYIRQKLCKDGITEKKMFPKKKRIAKDISKKALANTNKIY